jgi:methionine aminotransferase
VSPETEITITAGGTEALFCAVQAVVHRGDEVILLDPAYDSYEPAVRLAGGVAVRVPLRRPGFDVDWERAREAFGRRPRLIIVNTPHNPSGAVFTRADLDALAELLEGTDALVLADEVYEHMVFDGAPQSAARFGRRAMVVVVQRTYHATGWKVGCCRSGAAHC